MTLNAFVAVLKKDLLDDLVHGRSPRTGTYDAAILAEARTKGEPQMGTTHFQPDCICVEFIFPEAGGRSTVLTVKIDPPERIVFMPVPEWVVESIWQGDVDGSYQFESDAQKLLCAYHDLLKPENNRALFGPRPSKHREASW